MAHKKAMLTRLQEIGTEEKLPPSQKPSFGPTMKFLKKQAIIREAIKGYGKRRPPKGGKI
jgi:hypothetical protein